jgi:hypothetical protein
VLQETTVERLLQERTAELQKANRALELEIMGLSNMRERAELSGGFIFNHVEQG